MNWVDPSTVYRDATYNVETQEHLSRLLRELERSSWHDMLAVEALRDVTARWDANDATETIFE